MAPILIEPLSEKAYELLRQLEALHILRVITPEPKVVAESTAPPRKWGGALAAISPNSAEEWNKYLHDIRNEWEREL